MLSAATLRTLEDFAQRSHDVYPEGGLIYTFTEAANQAHSKFPKDFLTRAVAGLPENELAQLALVLGRALGGFHLTSADASSVAIARELLDKLQADLEFDAAGAASDDWTSIVGARPFIWRGNVTIDIFRYGSGVHTIDA